MNKFSKTLPLLTAGLLTGSLLLSGCSTNGPEQASAPSTEQQDTTQAASLQINDPWAKAADKGMSAAFGTLRNTGQQPVELVKVTEEQHRSPVQLHEMTGSGTEMTMKEHQGPVEIKPGAEVELMPGGMHFMYMDLAKPLVASETSTLTLHFADGSSKAVDFPIRNYSGAKERYEDHAGMEDKHGNGEHGGH
ncbi:copper chaperone PCu(A)C [Glutamicibacter sp. X7]